MSACALPLDGLPVTEPDVSILTPIFNAEAFLAEAIESVLTQLSPPRWELLLVDDGSTDSSVTIAQRYVRQFPTQIRLLRHPGGRNLGASATRNVALRQARAPVVALLDADDVWLPCMLTTQLALLQRYPEAAMVYANAERTVEMKIAPDASTGPRGQNYLPPLLPTGRQPGLLSPLEPLEWFLRDETLTPCTCTVLLRTAAARALGGFEEEFAGLYDDQALYAKVAMTHRIAVTTACVARYRIHDASCCARGRQNLELQANARTHFEQWLVTYQRSLLHHRREDLVAAG